MTVGMVLEDATSRCGKNIFVTAYRDLEQCATQLGGSDSPSTLDTERITMTIDTTSPRPWSSIDRNRIAGGRRIRSQRFERRRRAAAAGTQHLAVRLVPPVVKIIRAAIIAIRVTFFLRTRRTLRFTPATVPLAVRTRSTIFAHVRRPSPIRTFFTMAREFKAAVNVSPLIRVSVPKVNHPGRRAPASHGRRVPATVSS